MTKFARFSLLLIALLSFDLSYGQKKNKTVEAAEDALTHFQFVTAAQLFTKAASDKSLKDLAGEMHFNAAKAYTSALKYSLAKESFTSAINAGFQTEDLHIQFGDLLGSMNDAVGAITQYNSALEINPKNQLASNRLDGVKKTQEWANAQTRYKVENFKPFNSPDGDYATQLYKKNGVVFVSNRETAVGKKLDGGAGERYYDLFESFVDKKGKWSNPEPVKGAINTPYSEGPITFTKSGSQAYYTVCGKGGGCRIYMSRRSGDGWSEPELQSLFGDSINVANPHLSDNNKEIFFSAFNAPGGFGGLDIWVAKRKGNNWEAPVNLGPMVNSRGNESFPVVQNDTALFFSSDYHSGMGSYDIFLTTMIADKWTKPMNLKAPINSTYDDFYFISNPSMTKGFLSSNRPGGKGGDDIWEWELTPLVFNLEVIVINDTTNKVEQGALVKLVTLPDSTFKDAVTNAEGKAKFVLKPDTKYSILVSKDGFFGNSDVVATAGEDFSKDFSKEIHIGPVPKQTIVLDDILYDLNKTNLRPESMKSLNVLVEFMKKYPNIRVGIYSHTDFRDTDERNMILSQGRAESCVNYLIANGVDSARLSAKGFGESKPITGLFEGKIVTLTEEFINKLSSKEQKEKAHQLNRRTEFEILGTDYEGNIRYRAVTGDQNATGTRDLFEGREDVKDDKKD